MKIVYLCLAGAFIDHYSYQDNLMSKYHKELGYEVEVIASQMEFDENGNIVYTGRTGTHFNENGIKVTKLPYREPRKLYRRLRRFVELKDALEEAKPDILFIHAFQFLDIDVVARYLKAHPNVKTYVDNHADYSNSARNWLSKNILHGVIWKNCAKRIEPYTEKFYGVLPARVDCLVDLYGLPKEKCELLVMGADDEKVLEAQNAEQCLKLRRKYGIQEDDFLVVTGGKNDKTKTQTLLLMEAIRRMEDPKVKLLVFGSVVPELKERFEELCMTDKVIYIGWLKSEDTYQYFAAADLVVFPGRHSVFWEQVAGQGIPMLCKYWDGTTHVDLGGNVKFLYEDSAEEMLRIITDLRVHPEKYQQMKAVAEEKGLQTFSYRDISRRSVE